jgi:hypothetical protein
MKRPTRALTIALVLCLTLWPVVASAQRIVLLRPKTPDPALLQAFGRLKGELEVHAFEVIVLEADDDAPSPVDLAKAAEQARAVGTISLLRSRGLASADVWISDRVTGKTSMRTIATAGRSEASSVLAIRAVDLLRASLREFGPGETPPADVVGAHPERSPKHVREWAAASTTRPHWAVSAGAVVQSTLSSLGSVYGPAVGLDYEPWDRLGFRLGFEGPLWGAKVSRQGSSLTLRNEQLFAGVGYRMVSRQGWGVEVTADFGAHHLNVQGKAASPYVGRASAAWVGLAAGGLGVELRLTPVAALVLRGRAVFLAPRPVLRLETSEFPYGRPMLQTGASLRVRF